MTKNERMIRVAVPKYDDFYGVLLKFFADGAIHSVEACQNFVRDEMQLTDEDLAEPKSDGQFKWLARVEWCLVTLEKSGLIRSQDAQYQITDAGRKLSGKKVTMKFLMELGMPALIEFVKSRRTAPKSPPPKVETPEEILDRVHGEIDDALSDELLSLLIEKSPQFFEKFTVKLM